MSPQAALKICMHSSCTSNPRGAALRCKATDETGQRGDEVMEPAHLPEHGLLA